ncbi:MAG: ATP-dependent Clp protease proteolytic subunit [Bacteroidota bacterium]|nr:ATP-dependent Clp protease proteolytic subunit [Bacteroidota bacterium]
MINKILDKIAGTTKVDDTEKKLLEKELEKILSAPPQPDLRTIGLFSDVTDEKIAELIHALIYLDEINRLTEEERPVEFYISTYGGSADDMFGMYDIMRVIRERTPIQTIGIGKVMSAGVLLLAAGTKGKRCIGKNCRVMVHSVIGGSHGPLHNLINEMDAIEQIQKMYSDALIEETNMTKKDLKKLLERKVNVYLSAEEAVELGIADVII